MPSWPHLMFGGIVAVLVALALALIVPGGEQTAAPQQAEVTSPTLAQ